MQTNSLSFAQVEEKLEEWFPSKNASKWDKTGFSFLGRKTEKVKGVVTCLDLTESVILKTKKLGFNLIISRHPLVFLDSISLERRTFPHKQKLFRLLRRFNISVYSLHTNFERTNSQAAREIAYRVFKKTNYSFLEPPNLLGAGVVELTQKWSLEELKESLKKLLSQESFRVVNPLKPSQSFQRILLLPGAWGTKDFLNKVEKLKIEVVLTSDLKWSDWVALEQTKKPMVCEVAHLIEQYWELSFKSFLRRNFPNLPHFHHLLTLPYKTVN